MTRRPIIVLRDPTKPAERVYAVKLARKPWSRDVFYAVTFTDSGDTLTVSRQLLKQTLRAGATITGRTS